MVYRGRVQDGVVVLDDHVQLPNGTKVQVSIMPSADSPSEKPAESLGQLLLRYAGRAEGLPADASENHDQYLYGMPGP